METPRFTERRLGVLAMVMFGLVGPTFAAAAPVGPEKLQKEHHAPSGALVGKGLPAGASGIPAVCPEEMDDEDEEEACRPLPEADRLRVLALLGSIMLLSGEQAPSDHTATMIVKFPKSEPSIASTGNGGHTTGFPTTVVTPEPTAMLSGLLGTGLAGLFSLLCGRKGRRCLLEEATGIEGPGGE